jgi:hypothetical protein
MVFVGNEAGKINTRSLGNHKATTSTTRGRLSHEKKTKSVENSKDLVGGEILFQKEKGFQGIDHGSRP